MIEAVGQRLQAVRKIYGWSQRELAKRSGVPNSAISVIEQGTVSPSVSSLERVLNGFPMSLERFFSIALSKNGCIVSTSKRSLEEGSLSSMQASLQNPVSDYDHLGTVEYSSGDIATVVPIHFVQKNCLVLVIEGMVSLHTIGFEKELKVGDSASIYGPLPIRMKVLSDSASWVLVTI